MKSDRPVTGGTCWTELGAEGLAAKQFCTRLFGRRPGTDPRQEAGGAPSRIWGRGGVGVDPAVPGVAADGVERGLRRVTRRILLFRSRPGSWTPTPTRSTGR